MLGHTNNERSRDYEAGYPDKKQSKLIQEATFIDCDVLFSLSNSSYDNRNLELEYHALWVVENIKEISKVAFLDKNQY
eukprot:scaffold2603_cov138-Skeletonema_menzelii.AAC.5